MKPVFRTIFTRRTIRKYKQKPLPHRLLQDLVKLAGLAPSAANLQPCEFIICNDQKSRDTLFPLLKWAGYIRPEGDPAPGERPMAYIIVLINEQIQSSNARIDAAAAMTSMILGAWELKIGSCWLGAVDRNSIIDSFHIPADRSVFGVLALGYPDESPQIVPMQSSVKYWKESGVLQVPKRNIEDLCFNAIYGQKNVAEKK